MTRGKIPFFKYELERKNRRKKIFTFFSFSFFLIFIFFMLHGCSSNEKDIYKELYKIRVSLDKSYHNKSLLDKSSIK